MLILRLSFLTNILACLPGKRLYLLFYLNFLQYVKERRNIPVPLGMPAASDGPVPLGILRPLRKTMTTSSTGREVRLFTLQWPKSGNLGCLVFGLLPSSLRASIRFLDCCPHCFGLQLQKGDVPAAPSGTATLLRLSPNYRFYPRPVFCARLQVPPAFMA